MKIFAASVTGLIMLAIAALFGYVTLIIALLTFNVPRPIMFALTAACGSGSLLMGLLALACLMVVLQELKPPPKGE